MNSNEKQAHLNKQLTIIITLFDRVKFTYRWMEYANHYHFPFKILLADGGKDEKIERHLNKIENYPNLNYQYIRFPYDHGYPEFYSKVNNTLNLVTTPFVLLGDNDDFFDINGLQNSVEFLSQNSNFSACRGHPHPPANPTKS